MLFFSGQRFCGNCQGGLHREPEQLQQVWRARLPHPEGDPRGQGPGRTPGWPLHRRHEEVPRLKDRRREGDRSREGGGEEG